MTLIGMPSTWSIQYDLCSSVLASCSLLVSMHMVGGVHMLSSVGDDAVQPGAGCAIGLGEAQRLRFRGAYYTMAYIHLPFSPQVWQSLSWYS